MASDLRDNQVVRDAFADAAANLAADRVVAEAREDCGCERCQEATRSFEFDFGCTTRRSQRRCIALEVLAANGAGPEVKAAAYRAGLRGPLTELHAERWGMSKSEDGAL